MFWLPCNRRLQKWWAFVGVWREWASSAGAVRPFASCSHSSESFSSFFYFIVVIIVVLFFYYGIFQVVLHHMYSQNLMSVQVRPLRAFWKCIHSLIVIYNWDTWYIDEDPGTSVTDPELPTSSSGSSVDMRELQNSCRSQCKLPASFSPPSFISHILSSFLVSLDRLMAALPDAPVHFETRHW